MGLGSGSGLRRIVNQTNFFFIDKQSDAVICLFFPLQTFINASMVTVSINIFFLYFANVADLIVHPIDHIEVNHNPPFAHDNQN